MSRYRNISKLTGRTAAPALSVIAGASLHFDSRNSTSYSGTGTVITDLSGASNHGTLVNGVGYNSITKGLTFNGSSHHISVPVQFNRPTGAEDFTVTSVFNTSFAQTGNTLLISQAQPSKPIPFSTYIFTNGTVFGYSRNNSGSKTVTVNPSLVVTDGLTHSTTFRKSGNIYSVFIDGVLLASTTLAVGSVTVTNNLIIGASGQSQAQAYQGEIFASLVYTTALSNADILTNHAALT